LPHADSGAAILTSFNRNFKGRNDGNVKTMNFLTSPDIVTAMAFAGRLSFNPLTDELIGADGKPFRFEPPSSDELPLQGFAQGNPDFLPLDSPKPDASVDIVISPSSTRLEKLEPFTPHFSKQQIESGEPLEFKDVRCLFRVRGKCTTDEVRLASQAPFQCLILPQISAAGPWLKYKGHLSNIAENTYM
jgi:aconitase A